MGNDSSTGEAPATTGDMPAPEATGDDGSTGEAEEPGWQLPEVWGVPVLEDQNPDENIVEVTLTASELEVPLSATETLTMLAYNGSVPGPLLQAKVGDEVIVHFENRIDEPTTIHWHGLRISEEMDGNPRIQDPVKPGEDFTYRYVVEEAGSYWYHPHVNANTQVEMGMQGPMVVHDPEDPVFDLERYLVLDDILLENGQFPPFLDTHMEQMHGRLGNHLLVNGEGSAREVDVEQGTVERWRLVNTSNARTMSLGISGASFKIVGTDGGRLAQPYGTDRIQMAVGQRYDVEVTYDNAGTAELTSYVLALDELGEVVEEPIPLLRANVAASEQTPRGFEWVPMDPAPERNIDAEASLTFDAVQGPDGSVQWTINGQSMPMEPLYTFATNDTIHLRLVNDAGPEHPFHLHGQFFRIIDDGRPETHQPGLKDTVLVPGQSVVEVIAYMDNPGHWMAHCHILEHAELGMMGEFVIE
jgi:FtsP/CotA-like multicopper oxidase with cupredoxin domain